jgi:hypothetical protein
MHFEEKQTGGFTVLGGLNLSSGAVYRSWSGFTFSRLRKQTYVWVYPKSTLSLLFSVFDQGLLRDIFGYMSVRRLILRHMQSFCNMNLFCKLGR